MGYGWHKWGHYSGRGPWAHLPPALRPGWWGMWHFGAPYVPAWDKETELRYLEDLRRYLTEVLKEVERRIEELKKT
jgi:hypothetical protein